MTTQRRQRGLTLVELLIAVAIGVLLLLGISLLFSQNRQSFRQNEEIARIQENARFAITELSQDIAMAGFFAEIVDGAAITVDGSVAGTEDCGPGGAPWLYDFANGLLDGAVRIADQATAADGAAVQARFDCVDAATFRAGTDVIGFRRTSGVAAFWEADPDGGISPACVNLRIPDGVNCVNAVPGRGIFVRENGTQAVLYSGAAPSAVPTRPFEDWEYTPRIYYVRDVDAGGNAIPTLCRMRLDNTVAGPQPLVEDCLVSGVENFQVELGVDTDGDGAANSYVSNPGAGDLERAVAVRIYLLMRALQPDVGYTDERQYALGNVVIAARNDRFHRRVYSTTVTMRNLNNMRRLGF